MLPHLSLTNFEILRYYQNEPRFNGVYSRDNLPNQIKYEAYVTNLDEYGDVGTNWIALYVLIIMLLILTVLQSNMFLKGLFVTKICKQTYFEYKQIIQ